MTYVSTSDLASEYLRRIKDKEIIDPYTVLQSCYPYPQELEDLNHGSVSKIARWIQSEICLGEAPSLTTIRNWFYTGEEGKLSVPLPWQVAFTHYFKSNYLKLSK